MSTDKTLEQVSELAREIEQRRKAMADIVRALGHGCCGLSHHEIAPLVTRHVAALKVATDALEAECKPFQFPDEDRPICYEALSRIKELLKP